MERFQVELSTRRKTTAFLPSWGGIPTRQHLGSSRGEAARTVRALRAARHPHPRASYPPASACSSETGTHCAQGPCPRARAGRGGPRADWLAFPGAPFSVFLVFSSVPGSSRGGSGARGTTCFIFGWAGRRWFRRDHGQK